MIVAAFDLATATGVCDGTVGGKPRLWTWHTDDGDKAHGARFHMLHCMLTKYFETQPCEGVVYERPLPLGVMGENRMTRFGKRVMVSDANVTLARGLIAVLLERCWYFNKQVEGFLVQPARVSVLGWSTNRAAPVVEKRGGGVRAETTKERVLREVTMLGVKAENDNEADAWVMWAYACNRLNPRLAVASTPLFRERKN